MAQSTDEECGICLDALTNPVALPCSHRFCSNCMESWRSKYGATKREEVGRACPLCRKKIPPSKEIIMQLATCRSLVKGMEAEGDTLSERYMAVASMIETLEQEVGDWTEAEALDYDAGEESLALPHSIFGAVLADDIQTVLDWLGPPPVDKNRINAKCAEVMNTTLVFPAARGKSTNLLSILLQLGADVNAMDAMRATPFSIASSRPEKHEHARLLLEWGAEIDPQYFRQTTKEEVVSFVLQWGNVKLANLVQSALGGRRCELVNYSTRPELNGKTCVVEKHLPDKDRYKIAFEGSGQKALVPPLNLKRRDRTPTDCGYYITFDKGRFSRCDFASKEECQAYVAEVEAKHVAEQLAGLDIGSSKGRRDKKKGKKKGRK